MVIKRTVTRRTAVGLMMFLALPTLALVAIVPASGSQGQSNTACPLQSIAVAQPSQQLSGQQQAEQLLKQMSEPVHRTKQAASDLVRECKRDAGYFEGGEIDFVGGDIIPILPSTAEGMGPNTYLPPRTK